MKYEVLLFAVAVKLFEFDGIAAAETGALNEDVVLEAPNTGVVRFVNENKGLVSETGTFGCCSLAVFVET